MVRFCSIFVLLILINSCKSISLLKEVKKIDSYPSASGIEYFNKQFYIIGDDATNLLISDSNLVPVDSIDLYTTAEKRIQKTIKPDLEALGMTLDNKLLVLGSGSLAPYRNTGWIIDPVTKQKDSLRLDIFYHRILMNGISELNIEGVCSIPGFTILINRGNKTYPKNHLLFTHKKFWERQTDCTITPIRMGFNKDSLSFTGVSGIAYAGKGDRLILTVSTEDTRNSFEDGAIGKSYLWIVKNISAKRNWKSINPDQIIDLESIDIRFKSQKIESVCVTGETKNFIELVLVADNDDGSSTLFKMSVEKE
jgi:hypothetical protein